VIKKLDVIRVGCNFDQTIEIICESEANPKAEIKWYFNRTELNNLNQDYVSSLFAYEIYDLSTHSETICSSKLKIKVK
jgi:hypothetical protein